MNRPLKYMNEKGFTLVEIIIVIVILGIISGVTFQIVASGVEAFKKSSARKELYDQGRLALERMVRELRDAKEITATSSDSITFTKVHQSAQDSAEEIKFQRNGANLERIADPSGSPLQAVLAANVDTFQVTFGGAGEEENWGIDQQVTSSNTWAHSRAMGGTSPDEDGMEIQSISIYLGAQTGDVRLAVYTGGALNDPQSATLLWDAGTVNPNGVAGWYTVNHPSGLSWPKNTVTWLAWKRNTGVAVYYSNNSSDAGDFQTARGRNDNNFSESPSVAFPSTYGETGSFDTRWHSIYVTSRVSGTTVVTLELTLTDPNDSGNSLSMRTKVFMRNVQ